MGIINWRVVIVGEGLARLDKLMKKVEEGAGLLYRTAVWRQYDRVACKKLKRKSWYGANVETVVFVQATRNEVLRKAVQAEADKSELRIRIVEKGGRNRKSVLQRSDVKPDKICNDPSCVVCLTSDKERCREENSGHLVECMQCEEINVQAIIHGETGRCARIRCGEHHRDLKNKAPRSNLYEHIVAIHDGDTDTKFKYEVVKVFQKDVLSRQLQEGMRIENQTGISLNSQNEWQAPAVI